MALKSDTASPPNGAVNIVNQESSGGDADDLEDGEIFDDDDGPSPTPTTPVPPPPPIITSLSPLDGGKRRGSPLRKGPPRRKLGKRARDEDRITGPRLSKLRRKSEEVDKSKEKEINEHVEAGEDVERGSSRDRDKESKDREWDRPNRGFPEDEDEEDEMRRPRYPMNRRGRSMRGRSRRRDNTCRFYFQGNCQRGADCPFTHGQPQHLKKYELCKFYMMDCCVKKDKCTFMHSEFPCKFFHLGFKCYSGKKCKFSHGKITPALKAALMRHVDSTVPKDRELLRAMRDRDRERDREHRDREMDRERDRSREKDVERDRRRRERIHEERDRDKYCLDFMRAAESRIPSDGEEGSRTPMPSPINDNNSSDSGLRVSRSPEKEHKSSPDRRKDKGKKHKERRKHKEKDKDIEKEKEWEREREMEWEREREKEREWERERSHETELKELVDRMELAGRRDRSPMFDVYSLQNQDNQPYLEERQEEGELDELIPLNLPKKQRELYLRIQQQQREAENIQKEEGEVEREEDYKEEDWYSSEDEEGGGSKKMEPLATILNSLKQPSFPEPAPTSSASLSVPVLPDIDINAVTKLLCSVRETIQQQQNQTGTSAVYPAMSENPRPPLLPLPSLVSSLVSESVSDKKRARDPRLRGNSSEEETEHRPPLHHGDVDLRQLPFKPAPSHSPANEIEASSTSHPPVLYRLRPIIVSLPDYSDISLKNKNDPRLRKYLHGGLSMHQQQTSLLPPQPAPALLPTPLSPGGGYVRPMLGEVRDPRQRALLANDPRRKSSMLLQQQRADSDLRQQPPPHPHPPYFGDVDLRMHQPTPHFAFK